MKQKFNIIIEAVTPKGEEELNKVLNQKGFIVSMIATKTRLQDKPPIMKLTFKGKTAGVWRMVLNLQKSDKSRETLIKNNILKNMFDIPLKHFSFKWGVSN